MDENKQKIRTEAPIDVLTMGLKIEPCCKVLQSRLLAGCSKISVEPLTHGHYFTLHNGEGLNPEAIDFCPYCGAELTIFKD